MGPRYEDKSICTFYSKIGACRHGEKCSRRHIKPTASYTALISNLYQNPKLDKNNEQSEITPKQLQRYFDQFYEDVFIRLAGLGEIISLTVCENENSHLNGNVYVKFSNMDSAYNTVIDLNQEWFSGRPVHCELSPVDNFNDATCRAHFTNSCSRGDHCNFMHVRKPTSSLKNSLYRSQEKSILLRRLAEVSKGGLEKTELKNNDVEENKKEQVSALTNESITTPHAHTAPASASVVERLFAT